MKTVVKRDPDEMGKLNSLGSLRLRNVTTNEIVLIPTPSNDPNDPLNWSPAFRYYVAVLVCAAIFFCNFLAAGPTVAIVDITVDFFGPPGPDFAKHISRVAYFFTTTALLQGMGNLLWMPLIIKFGRRPAYVASFTLYVATAAWAGGATSYGSELSARILMGFASGAAECLAPLTISDLFFLHERGAVMAIYTCALSAGVSGGIIIAGLITIKNNWRYIYWVSVALIGACVVLVYFTFPETYYKRDATVAGAGTAFDPDISKDAHLRGSGEVHKEEHYEEMRSLPSEHNSHGPQKPIDKDLRIEEALSSNNSIPAKKSYMQSLALWTGTYTSEAFMKLAIRPVVLLTLPPVLWATLVMSVTIGFIVAISSNFASAFQTAYGFKSWQSGLCFISGMIGNFIGIFAGGKMSDAVADYFTRRNRGVREPEMRLPAILISVITGPLALLLYGAGIDQKLHWICPTIGLGLLSFSIVQATNVTLVYTIDAYRPVAGEITVTQLAFKSAFGFLLSFYTNPWIDQSGYLNAFGAMAGISGGVMIMFIPFYFFGKQIRHATWHWGFIKKLAHWDEDREVGE